VIRSRRTARLARIARHRERCRLVDLAATRFELARAIIAAHGPADRRVSSLRPHAARATASATSTPRTTRSGPAARRPGPTRRPCCRPSPACWGCAGASRWSWSHLVRRDRSGTLFYSCVEAVTRFRAIHDAPTSPRAEETWRVVIPHRVRRRPRRVDQPHARARSVALTVHGALTHAYGLLSPGGFVAASL
jgi:hypothetical protein